MKYFKFLTCLFSFFCINIALAQSSSDYLKVSHWQDCVIITVQNNQQSACLPRARPQKCPLLNWSQLTRFNLAILCRNL